MQFVGMCSPLMSLLLFQSDITLSAQPYLPRRECVSHTLHVHTTILSSDSELLEDYCGSHHFCKLGKHKSRRCPVAEDAQQAHIDISKAQRSVMGLIA